MLFLKLKFKFHSLPRASLAQWLERVAVNHKVAGSIPAGGVFVCVWAAQRGAAG